MAMFSDRLAGSIYGTAIGDAMGAPVEGWPSVRVREAFGKHDFTTFIPPTKGEDPNLGKGNGRITDDTLMAEVLIRAYGRAQDHLDAYGYAQHIIPLVKGTTMWVPERGREMELWERLYYPEKYPWIRHVTAHVDPRSAGIGNCVNCGVAMWMLPAGAVNAGDPWGAYQEAASIGTAHNESFAVEAGAVMAAAAAAAFADSASIQSVASAALSLARDGTGGAVKACLNAVDPSSDIETFASFVRKAVAPYDQHKEHASDDQPLVEGVSDEGRPSRVASIEELPVALACLRYGDGDFVKTLRASVLYGRDCDSIAGMACGLFGALYGTSCMCAGLLESVNLANRRDFGALAGDFAATIRRIHEKDLVRFAGRVAALESD